MVNMTPLFFYSCDLFRCANMIFFKTACHSPTRNEMDYGGSGAQAAPRTEQYPASVGLFASSFNIPLDRSDIFVACNLHMLWFYCRVRGVFSQTRYWVLDGGYRNTLIYNVWPNEIKIMKVHLGLVFR